MEPEAYLKPCETLLKHIQNPATGHFSALNMHIQKLVQRLHMKKPGILRNLEYLGLFHNCTPRYIHNPAVFTKTYEIPELWHI